MKSFKEWVAEKINEGTRRAGGNAIAAAWQDELARVRARNRQKTDDDKKRGQVRPENIPHLLRSDAARKKAIDKAKKLPVKKANRRSIASIVNRILYGFD